MLLSIEKEEDTNKVQDRRFFLFLIFTFFLSSFSYSSEYKKQYDNWWTDRPVDSLYYFGVGRVDSRDENAPQLSHAMAVEQLTLQLFLDITSSSKRDIKEKDDISIKNEYDAKVEVFSKSQLSDIEIYLTRESDNIYYTLVRLDKKKFQEYRDKKVKDIRGLYDLGVYDDNTVAKLQYFVQAYETLLKVPDDVIYHEDKNLRNEIPNQINSIMSGLSVTHIPRNLNGQYDRPIGDSLVVLIKRSNKTKAVKGLPINFKFKKGSGRFVEENVQKTNRVGRVVNKINRIDSKERQQTVHTFVDLSTFLVDETSKKDQYILDKLKAFQESATRTYLINVTETFSEDIALIAVGKPQVFSEDDLNVLNTEFRNSFGSEYNLVDGERVDNVIEDGGYTRTSDLCTNDACQLKIGKDLGVDKLIFVNILYYPASEKPLKIEVTLRNISDRNKPAKREMYSFSKERYPVLGQLGSESSIASDKENNSEFIGPLPNKNELESGDNSQLGIQLVDFITNNIPELLEHFWNVQNPALIKIEHPVKMTGKLVYKNPSNHWFKKEYKLKIPEYGQREFQTGDYTMFIDHEGYEPIRKSITLSPGTNTPPINFIRKSPKTALIRSLIIPGLGQFYSSEKAFQKRRYIGYVFTTVATMSIITTGSAWGSYTQKKIDYEDAYDIYMNQKLIEGVENNRLIAQQKNKEMQRQFSSALLMTGLTAAVWIGSAIEAFVNFPDYGMANNSVGMNIALQTFSGEPVPVIQVNYTW